METIDQIKAVQGKLGLTTDGVAGPKTWAAIYTAIIGEKPATGPIVLDSTGLDERTRKNIATLLPEVQPHAVQFMQKLKEQGYDFRITSGTRTYEEQNELYAQGRTKKGPIVTNARGGQSNHNFGIAFDITLFKGLEPVWDGPEYKKAGEIGREIGFEWGGDWTGGLVDEPHFQWLPPSVKGLSSGQQLAMLRAYHDSGKNPFTV